MNTDSFSERRLGRYVLLARLGSGGMAEIFLARESGATQPLAIKRLLPHLAADPTFAEQFRQEARFAAQLRHPHIVDILEFVEADGAAFLVMEYVDGSTLKDLLAASSYHHRQIPVEVAVAIMVQACRGAQAAHELTDSAGALLGLVHRDISPHNLMVNDTGRVKLLDFGIAKATAQDELTRTGGIRGKLHYLSPEQVRQEALDRRSDVFALGITLWELLTGEPLFKRDTDLSTMQAVLQATLPNLRASRPDVPEALAQALSSALERDPARRTATAELFRQQIFAAAKDAGLAPTDRAVATFVLDALGETHARTRASIAKALCPSKNRRAKWSRMGALLGLLAGALALGFFMRGAPAVVLQGEPLTIGLPPTLDAAVVLDEYEPWRRYLERHTGRPIHLIVAKTYAELAERLTSGQIPYASLPPYLYVRTRAQHDHIEPLAMELFEGSTGDSGVLLVLESSPINSVSEVKGRRFCYSDPNSTTGYVFPRAALRAAGVDPDHDLAGVRFSGNHLEVLRDLNAGLCDAGATYSSAYRTADRAGISVGRMRVLAVTGRSPNDAVCAGASARPEDSALLKRALLAFNPERDLGVPLLGKVERVSGFVAVDDSSYTALRKALRE